jgi:mono/diheme cytochrome c family protein
MCSSRGSKAVPAALIALALTIAPSAWSEVTYSGQVRRILDRHCVGCHDDKASTISLASFEAARQRATQLLAAVENGSMPPWPVDRARSARMRNDPRLSAADAESLHAWVASGMARGNESESAQVSGSWEGAPPRPPDAIFALQPIMVPAAGEMPYVRVLIKVDLPSDRWIEALQAVPGDPSVVHHMGLAEVSLPPGVGTAQVREMQEVAAKLGMPGRSLIDVKPAVSDPTSSGAYDMLAAYTPGDGLESYAPGTGRLLKGGGNYYINFNIHYTATGTAATDRSRIALWFRKEAPEQQLIRTPSPGRTLIAEGRELSPDDPGTKAEGTDVAIPAIAPNEANYELIGITPFAVPVTLFSFQPHAHLRGKDFLYEVVYPDGRTRTLLSIPHYDYHLQLHYDLADPVALPAGAKLIVTAHYDNSPSNTKLSEMAARDPSGRCGPDKYAFFRSQNQTWDEMFSPLVQYGVRLEHDQDARQRAALPMVSVRGCLVAEDGARWSLRRASDAIPTNTAAVSRAELAATPGQLGATVYHLIGANPFRPAALSGRQVFVKGLRIAQRTVDAINVTAMVDTGSDCEP